MSMFNLLQSNPQEQIYKRICGVLPKYTEALGLQAHTTYSVVVGSYDNNTNQMTLNLATQITDANTQNQKYKFATFGTKITNNIQEIKWLDDTHIQIKTTGAISIANPKLTLDNSFAVQIQGITTQPSLNQQTWLCENSSGFINSKEMILVAKDNYINQFADILNEGYIEQEYDFGFNGLQENIVSFVDPWNSITFQVASLPNGWLVDFTNTKLAVWDRFYFPGIPAVNTDIFTTKNNIGKAVFQLSPSSTFVNTSKDATSMASDITETAEQQGRAVLLQEVVRYELIVGIPVKNDNLLGAFSDKIFNFLLCLRQKVGGLEIKFDGVNFTSFKKSRLSITNSPQYLQDLQSHFIWIFELSFVYSVILSDFAFNGLDNYTCNIDELILQTSKDEEYKVMLNEPLT